MRTSFSNRLYVGFLFFILFAVILFAYIAGLCFPTGLLYLIFWKISFKEYALFLASDASNVLLGCFILSCIVSEVTGYRAGLWRAACEGWEQAELELGIDLDETEE
jgi:hypothetical protein